MADPLPVTDARPVREAALQLVFTYFGPKSVEEAMQMASTVAAYLADGTLPATSLPPPEH